MSKRKLQNNTLDLVGKRLIKTANRGSNEIEKIISNPQLFSLVRARIAANCRGPVSAMRTKRTILFFARQYSMAIAGAAVVFITIIIGATGILRPEKNDIVSAKVQIPEIGRTNFSLLVPDVARPDPPDKPIVGKLTAGRASDQPAKIEKLVAKSHPNRSGRKTRTPPALETQAVFYPLSAGYDTDESGGRIIRVDIQRSSLFALGVNIPLENGPDAVKADLLIGPDGITRAIRVVQ